jgi:hypothetical protein
VLTIKVSMHARGGVGTMRGLLLTRVGDSVDMSDDKLTGSG